MGDRSAAKSQSFSPDRDRTVARTFYDGGASAEVASTSVTAKNGQHMAARCFCSKSTNNP